jgi:nucleoside phosphorylase/CheY-like chemotaxis protein
LGLNEHRNGLYKRKIYMKILIVDDDQVRAKEVKEELTEAGTRSADIRIAHSANEARRLLRVNEFDLMILDIVLPRKIGEEPNMAISLQLLEDLDEPGIYHRPALILGLTAYPSAYIEAQPKFSERLWTVLQDGSNFFEPLKRSVQYLQDRSKSTKPYDFDLCVITALRTPELEAVYRLPWNWDSIEPLDDSTFVRMGHFNSCGQDFRVVTARASRMGMVATGLLSCKLITRYRPRFIAMVGICAGVVGKANIGDVILANPTWDWQSGKRVRDRENSQFSIAPHQLGVPEFVKARFEELAADSVVWKEIRDKWEGPRLNPIRLIVGPVASGSAVLADGKVVEEIKRQHRNLVGIEMEAYGLYAAAASSTLPRPTAFALKSVCDYANPDKSDDHQGYAAYTSAETLRVFAERYMAEIHELAGL